MGYKTKLDPTAETTVSLGGKNSEGTANPTSIEGYYLGAKEVKSEYGNAKLHVFQTSSGNVGVWGKTNLDRILTSSHAGQMCLVTFTGMSVPTKKGRKPAYKYELQYDEENTIDVAGLNLNASEPDYETSEEEESEENFEASEEIEAAPPVRAVAPARAATTPSMEAQARVKALLNGRGSHKVS